MATTKITSPDLFNLESLNTALKLPSGTTAERPTSPSTGEWRYNTTTNLVEYYDGGSWRELLSEDIPPVPSENFNTVLYDGTSATQSITGVGFQPDFVWIKRRDGVENHYWQDSSRGSTQQIYSNLTNAQFNETTAVTSFDSDGFTMGSYNGINNSGESYVAWCWKLNGGTTSSNTDGTITSTVQVNSKAGISIVQWTGTGSAGTLGHGLSSAPEMIIVKDTTNTYNWYVYSTATGSNIGIEGLNTTALSFSATSQMTSTSTLIENVPSVASLNTSGANMLIYAFHSVAGYSKIGSYAGNGSDDGPIINTGFEPAWLMIKVITGSGDGWFMVDNKRDTSNPRGIRVFANSDVGDASEAGAQVDFFSNGFQLRGSGAGQGQTNKSGSTYLYIAFASDASSAPVLTDSFANKLYTGTGSTQSITGLGFSPNYVWMKQTTFVDNHYNMDSVRGAAFRIHSNLTAAQGGPDTNRFTSFDTDGFTIGSDPSVNQSGSGFVTWNWKANPVPTINTDGGIQSIVSANQASGFSIVKWDGTGSASTVGHGLSAAPEIILTKRLNGVGDWYSFSVFANGGTTPANYFLKLNSTDAETLNTGSPPSVFAGTVPTATVFSVGPTLSGSSSDNYIAYCFASISGFSKIGTYTGNGSANNAITGLGFQPDWLMIKNTTDAGNDWQIYDSVRSVGQVLLANSDSAEANNSSNFGQFDSDGFTVQSNNDGNNKSGSTYIYMAFKENPAQYAIPSGQMGYLVAAGGGSGANSGAGGGAGGLRTTYGTTSGGGASAETNLTLAAGTYTITVGAGGVSRGAGSSPPAYGGQGLSGSDSTITGVASVSTVGGGGGGSNSQSAAPPISASGLDGGSGGGQGPSAASGETPGSGTANEGFGGGTSSLSAPYGSGGGGGAGSAGGNRVSSTPGNGGDGLTISITGSNSGYAGGGGGSGGTSANFGLGTSGGGNGAPSTGTGISGTANTGGGGGGGGDTRAAGSGGSGIVVLRLNTSDYSGAHTGSPTVTTSGSETILTYTGSGTYVHS